MINHLVAIERLMEQASHRVELNNNQPFRDRITVAETVEARAAELISHSQHRLDELVEELRRARGRLEVIRDDIRAGVTPIAESIDAAVARIDRVLGKVVA